MQTDLSKEQAASDILSILHYTRVEEGCLTPQAMVDEFTETDEPFQCIEIGYLASLMGLRESDLQQAG